MPNHPIRGSGFPGVLGALDYTDFDNASFCEHPDQIGVIALQLAGLRKALLAL